MTFQERLEDWREQLNGADYIARVEAEKFVAMMSAEHPSELQDWLTAHAVTFAVRAFRQRDQDARRIQRTREPQRSFADAIQASADGAGVGVFEKYLVINDDALRRPIGEMTGRDHAFVARNYANTGKQALLLAAFHGALEKKVGERRTSEVFTEEQYLAMRDQVLSKDAAVRDAEQASLAVAA